MRLYKVKMTTTYANPLLDPFQNEVTVMATDVPMACERARNTVKKTLTWSDVSIDEGGTGQEFTAKLKAVRFDEVIFLSRIDVHTDTQ